MSYNVHQILHFAKPCLFGPPWPHSCFSFEVNMGRLLKLITSANGVALQIVTRIVSSQGTCKHSCTLSDKRKHHKKTLGRKVCSSGKPVMIHDDFSAHLELCGVCIVEFCKVGVGCPIIAAQLHSRHISTSSTAVTMFPDGTYARAKRIIGSREPCEEHFFLISVDFVLPS